MYQVLFHLKMALNYLKRDKKVSETKKNILYKELEELLHKAEKLKEEFY